MAQGLNVAFDLYKANEEKVDIMKRIKLAPSILNADFSELRNQIKAVEPFADMIHLDVMDGNFVPNITFGPLIIEAVRKITNLPLDVHLMIYNPPEWIETFREAGADRISFHVQASENPDVVLRAIRALGASPGLALSPEVPVFELRPYLQFLDFVVVMLVYPGFGGQEMMSEMLNRVGAIKREAIEMGVNIEVEVDGGVKTENLSRVIEAGSDIVVVGSSIFKSESISNSAREIRSLLYSGR